MEIDDYPLLNEPSVMLAALKTASDGPADSDDCLHRLETSLEQARVGPPPDLEPLRRRVAAAYRYLQIAGLVDVTDDARFVITERGQETLRDHPMGVDGSVLIQFPEFRAFIRTRPTRQQWDEESAAPAESKKNYDEGYAACHGSGAITDNPYDLDTIAHLDWENGWCEARDEA